MDSNTTKGTTMKTTGSLQEIISYHEGAHVEDLRFEYEYEDEAGLLIDDMEALGVDCFMEQNEAGWWIVECKVPERGRR